MVPNIPSSRLVSISPDNQTIAYFYPGPEGRYGIRKINSPAPEQPKRYLPDPFGNNTSTTFPS